MTDSEQIAELKAKIERLEAENRILEWRISRMVPAGRQAPSQPGIKRAKARAWRAR